MLFNLTNHRSFPVNKGKDAIVCWKDVGPWFGGSFDELSARYQPLNLNKACWSYENKDSYSIPVDAESANMLTNLKFEHIWDRDLCKFTISELEVWGITFKE